MSGHRRKLSMCVGRLPGTACGWPSPVTCGASAAVLALPKKELDRLRPLSVRLARTSVASGAMYISWVGWEGNSRSSVTGGPCAARSVRWGQNAQRHGALSAALGSACCSMPRRRTQRVHPKAVRRRPLRGSSPGPRMTMVWSVKLRGSEYPWSAASSRVMFVASSSTAAGSPDAEAAASASSSSSGEPTTTGVAAAQAGGGGPPGLPLVHASVALTSLKLNSPTAMNQAGTGRGCVRQVRSSAAPQPCKPCLQAHAARRHGRPAPGGSAWRAHAGPCRSN